MSLFDKLPFDVLGFIQSSLTSSLLVSQDTDGNMKDEDLNKWSSVSQELNGLLDDNKRYLDHVNFNQITDSLHLMKSLWDIGKTSEMMNVQITETTSHSMITNQYRIVQKLLQSVPNLKRVYNSQMEFQLLTQERTLITELDLRRSNFERKRNMVCELWTYSPDSPLKRLRGSGYSAEALTFAREVAVYQMVQEVQKDLATFEGCNRKLFQNALERYGVLHNMSCPIHGVLLWSF